MSSNPGDFRLAINMAGAISAGAYTAGVLDFLIEALEEWQTAKDAFRAQMANHASSMTNVVPLHGVRLEAMTGASAGGMCAAIASVMLQGDFQHIVTGDEGTGGSPPTTNTFYEGWVNQIDISKLLGDGDAGQPLTSLLDSTIIDSIAQSAIVLPAVLKPKPFLSPGLQLFLMLTNVRGLSYPMYTDASMSTEEFVAYYGDKLRFQVVSPAGSVADASIKPLPLGGKMTDGAWPLLIDAAKATGAFPIFLAPRKLLRDLGDYTIPPWISPSQTNPAIAPELPDQPPPNWFTLNVDGGMTDNDPMELASDFLAATNPNPVMVNGCPRNPTTSDQANCAVLSVAPFPVVERYNKDYFPQKPGDPDPANIFTMVGKLFSVLLSQSRFFGEALSDIASGVSFDRFAIAPSDPDSNPAGDKTFEALQSSSLGAFGGFLDRKFRKHDFLLGRRNCQKFLMSNFLLPVTNPVIAEGMTECGAWAGAVQLYFKKPPPNQKADPKNQVWIPIIPLCGSALTQVPLPVRETMSEDDLDRIVDQVMNRIKTIKGPLLTNAPGILKFAADVATSWPFNGKIKTAIKNQLWKSLGTNIDPVYQDQDQDQG